MKGASAPLPVYEVASGNQVLATICGGVYSPIPGARKLAAREKAAIKVVLSHAFDGMTMVAGLSITLKA